MAYEIFLKKGEEKRILAGHPWVYANEVSRIEGKDRNGALATVRAFDGRFLGKGYINHASKILVRIFLRGKEEDGEELFFARIHAANAFRRSLGYDNCYRAVFAEADDLPARCSLSASARDRSASALLRSVAVSRVKSTPSGKA